MPGRLPYRGKQDPHNIRKFVITDRSHPDEQQDIENARREPPSVTLYFVSMSPDTLVP